MNEILNLDSTNTITKVKCAEEWIFDSVIELLEDTRDCYNDRYETNRDTLEITFLEMDEVSVLYGSHCLRSGLDESQLWIVK
jgi:hypothetical protein